MRASERKPVMNGRWSRGALPYAKHSGHRDPTVFHFDTYSAEGARTGWRTSLYCVSFQLPRPGPGDRFLVWFLVAYFLRDISSEMGQVLRRVYVEIDGTRILPWERCTIQIGMYVRIREVMNKEIGKLIKEIGAVTEDRVPTV